jgi:hypothetical protein
MTLSETAWKRVFLVKGIYNIAVSVVLLIWANELLSLFGAPVGNRTYVQMFLLLCLSFGIGYVIVALQIDCNAGIVVMGIVGQLSVFSVVIAQWVIGNAYAPALVSGAIDFVFAIAFAIFLWTHNYPFARFR